MSEIKAGWDAILAAGILGGIFGGMLSAFLTHRLTLWREKRVSIKAEKLKIIPLIEGFIFTAKAGELLGEVRFNAQQQLFEPAMRFRVHLNGATLERFNEAWTIFHNTTREEVHIVQPNEPQGKNEEMKQILVSRLENLLKTVKEM
jgi:hypothetical protein